MTIYKIVQGYVIQEYDPKSKQFISQHFCANDCGEGDHWENEKGEKVLGPKEMPYCPFDMADVTKE